MKCNECISYELFKIISSGKPYWYTGDIPCLRCKHFYQKTNDEFKPVRKISEEDFRAILQNRG